MAPEYRTKKGKSRDKMKSGWVYGGRFAVLVRLGFGLIMPLSK
jgi:hypothetical protein